MKIFPDDSLWNWVESYLSTGCAFIGVRGKSQEACFEVLGVDQTNLEYLSPFDVGERFGSEYPIVRSASSGEWVWMFEPVGGSLGSPDKIKDLSVDGDAFSVFESGSGGSWFVYARAGELITFFDTDSIGTRQGIRPDEFETEMQQVGLRKSNAAESGGVGKCFALVTAVFGLTVTAEQIQAPLLTGEVAPSNMDWLDEG